MPFTEEQTIGINLLSHSEPVIHILTVPLTQLASTGSMEVLSPMRLRAHLPHQELKRLIVPVHAGRIAKIRTIKSRIEIQRRTIVTGLVQERARVLVQRGVGYSHLDGAVDPEAIDGERQASRLEVPVQPGRESRDGLRSLFEGHCPLVHELGVEAVHQ